MENRIEDHNNIFRRLFPRRKTESPPITPEVVVIENIPGVSTYETVEARDPQAILKDCLEKSMGFGLRSYEDKGLIFRGQELQDHSWMCGAFDGDLSYLDMLDGREFLQEFPLNYCPKAYATFEVLPDESCIVAITIPVDFRDRQNRPIHGLCFYSKMPQSLAVELYQQAQKDASILKQLLNQGVGDLFESQTVDGRKEKPLHGETIVLLDTNRLLPGDMRKRDKGQSSNQKETNDVLRSKIISDPGLPW